VGVRVSARPSEARPRYWAFLSYSHKDVAFGRRLHRKLESYGLPRKLVGLETNRGTLPHRLVPIFRDRDELPAATDLTAEVRAALERSQALVVVCSPAAAASRWVGREVAVFRSLHPDRPILVAVISGEPSDVIPKVVYQELDGRLIEPLAADFRSTGDGKRHALLKLIAGIAGLNLDSLVQRDAQRRIRRVMAITVVALLGMIAMGVLTVFALTARADANRQRAEAEGLVEFMLTGLRATLKGVGRLDAMSAVNARALRYYSDQNLEHLPPESIERRARILHAMGEDDESRGDFARATQNFEQARRSTDALLRTAPHDPMRIFNHAQSEYWIGQVAFAQHRYDAAYHAFGRYDVLADQLLAVDAKKPQYLLEKGYAQGNLCASFMKPPTNPAAALKACRSALRYVEAAARYQPSGNALTLDIENRHAWLADACYATGDRACEKAQRQIQEQMLASLMRADPRDMQLKTKWIAAQRALALIDAEEGDEDGALHRLHQAVALSDHLTAFDPSNKVWVDQRKALDWDMDRITRKFTERKQQ
jgi:hypothetical protein